MAEVVAAPAPTKEDLDKLAKQVASDLSNQVLTEYTTDLKARLGTTINEKELGRAIGTSEE